VLARKLNTVQGLTYLRIYRCRVELVEERWERVRSQIARRSNTITQSILQVLSCNSKWVPGRWAESDGKVVEDCIEKVLVTL
jgi:hypothetical protein